MRKPLKAAAAGAASSLVLAATLGVGVASATDHGEGAPVAFGGFTACAVSGKITFSPALRNAATGTSSAKITVTLSACSNASQGGVTLTGGFLQGLVELVRPDACSTVIKGTMPFLSGGTVRWEPSSQVKPSTGISLPTGRGSLVTTGGKSYVQIAYSDGSVGGGSFANTRGTSVTIISTEDSTQLLSRCANGLSSVAFTGTATL